MENLPDSPDQIQELDFRSVDGLHVYLYWVKGTMSTFVEVIDLKTDDFFRVVTPEGVFCQEVFRHPYVYRVEDGNAA